MPELSTRGEDESTWIDGVVSEFRADNWDWVKDKLRDKADRLQPLPSAERNPSASPELDEWNLRLNEYYEFLNFAMPLHESRLGRLAGFSPHTLNGLAAKARVIHTEYMGVASSDETTANKVVRSIFHDIQNIMGQDG
jgi:hypothetical protein